MEIAVSLQAEQERHAAKMEGMLLDMVLNKNQTPQPNGALDVGEDSMGILGVVCEAFVDTCARFWDSPMRSGLLKTLRCALPSSWYKDDG